MLMHWIQSLFPTTCCLCQCAARGSLDLCLDCKEALPWLTDRCIRCGRPMDNHSESSVHCFNCIQRPPSFDRLCALFSYEPLATHLLLRLKFGGQLAYGNVLGELLAEKIADWYRHSPLPEAVIPVPLHPQRLQNRGFNQALELLRPQKKHINVPIRTDIVERIRQTMPQAQLPKHQRLKNLDQAFRIKKSFPYKYIALMDDVVSTGATVNAIAILLKEHGVESIDIWCICRA